MNEDVSLNAFTDINVSGQTSIYSAVLEAFDRIEQLQEPNRVVRDLLHPCNAILDVGCGTVLEKPDRCP